MISIINLISYLEVKFDLKIKPQRIDWTLCNKQLL